MTPFDLSGRTAIVTGAGSGIGRELAKSFAAAGARVVCCGRRLERLDETVGLIEDAGNEALAVAVDITRWSQVQAAVQRALDWTGRVDLLFNNAGRFGSVGPLWDADPDDWWRDVEVNLLGTMHCCRAALPHMMACNEGVIVNMDGGGGSSGPNPGGTSYAGSKAGIVRLTESLARELEQVGSAVMAVTMNPGFVHSDMTEGLVSSPQKAEWQPFVKRHLDTPAEVRADACAQSTLAMLKILDPAMNGCAFAYDTDWARVAADLARIQDEGLYTMRLRRPHESNS